MAERLPEPADIGDYAIIGNCHTAALVSRDGCIDWWCPVRFDAPAVFAALLDHRHGGRWWVGPRGFYRSHRRYVDGTNVLETTFTCEGGVLRLTDFMPIRAGHAGAADGLEPRLGIVRILECVEGQVEVGVHYAPRWDYGRSAPRLHDRGSAQGIYCTWRGDALLMRSDVPIVVRGDHAVGGAVLRAGERRVLGIAFAESEPLILPPLGEGAARLAEDTIAWWREWLDACRYDGPHREAVHRSALTLKLLCYAPSGAIVASPTTSLPEDPGGVRNWDYRYCWMRDASMTMRALLDLGFSREAEQFFDWLIVATQATAPKLLVMYDLYGNPVPRERTIEWLSGHRGSRPVRIGNAAGRQRQLDLYGELLASALAYAHRGGKLDRTKSRLLVQIGREACRAWDQPDAGIWEIRGDVRHHTHSKVNCWRALAALIELAEGGHLRVPVQVDRLRLVADRIRDTIEDQGYDRATESYVSAFGHRAVDASLLLLGIQGYTDPRAPRMVDTWRRLRRELRIDGLWRRYAPEAFADGLPGSEGAFGICSFWAVEYLARIGRTDEALREFERLLGYANDLGLYGEEIGRSGATLGNFPQGFTHIGLISAATAIARTTKGRVEAA